MTGFEIGMLSTALGGLGMQGASAGGLFGGPKLQGASYDQKIGNWTRRQNQIGEFAKTLANSRANLSNQYTNFYNNAYSRFVPLAETQFAARGFSPFGGAYQSALAKEASKYQDQGMVNMAQAERDDLRYVDSQYAANESALQGMPLQPSVPSSWQGFGNSLGQNLTDFGTYAGLNSYNNRQGKNSFNPDDGPYARPKNRLSLFETMR